MSLLNRTFDLSSPSDTAQFAARLARLLTSGDVVLLEGEVGAGKTHFARALIQTRLGHAEDVPSPTFTLVQTYDGGDVEIWHADLYRLTSAQEIEELGLIDAFETEICLIEWPDRLGDLAPKNALKLSLSSGFDEDARVATACWSDKRWADILDDCLP